MDKLDVLPPSQRRVAELICRGFKYREVAAELGLSVWTVKFYAKQIYARTGQRGRVELAAWVNQHA